MRPPRFLAATFLLLAAACSHQSPEAQLLKSTAAAASWIPAMQMTAEKWLANSVPSTFVKSAAEAAVKEIEKTEQEVKKSKAQEALRTRIARDLEEGRRLGAALQRAAQDDNPRAMVPDLPAFRKLKADFDAMQREYGGGGS